MELPPVSEPQGELAVLLDPQPGQLLTCPPGFANGMDFGPSLENQPVTSKVNLASVLSPSDDVLALFREEKVEEKENTDYKVYITTVIMICIVIVILFVKLLITHLEDVQMEGSTFKPLERETNSNFK